MSDNVTYLEPSAMREAVWMMIRVLDYETTGDDPNTAQVCEYGYCDVTVPLKQIGPTTSRLCHVSAMPPQARAVHHISQRDCEGQLPFNPREVHGENVYAFAAHNADFEQAFTRADVPFICTYKVALRIWPDAPSHSNGALRYWLEDQGKIAPQHRLTQPAHRAGPDAYVTAHLLLAMLNADVSVSDMLKWSGEPKLMPRCPIGKFRGEPWSAVEFGFLQWMVRNPDMEADLKWNARREIERRQRGR